MVEAEEFFNFEKQNINSRPQSISFSITATLRRVPPTSDSSSSTETKNITRLNFFKNRSIQLLPESALNYIYTHFF